MNKGKKKRLEKMKKKLMKKLDNGENINDKDFNELFGHVAFSDDFVMTEEDEEGNLINIETGEIVGNGFVDLGILYTK
ncbi:hypothetical protein R77591_00166 [Ralstonia mannitolilytica]|uniref:Uncharacterized protein n=2 Tax=Ralstonia TaxID=48736 RepID=A0AAD2EHF2_9RALS|nr:MULTISPECIES: hypothetical protein [Ralstonia]CAJ0679097.1 hypothetical protein R77591_00166 [Ralstonia mannitolilytica]CAJ0723751.1 hypothetical protein R38712_02119 [Ralstonia pickettii]